MVFVVLVIFTVVTVPSGVYWLYLPWLRCLVVFVVLFIFTMATVPGCVCYTGYICHIYAA